MSLPDAKNVQQSSEQIMFLSPIRLKPRYSQRQFSTTTTSNSLESPPKPETTKNEEEISGNKKTNHEKSQPTNHDFQKINDLSQLTEISKSLLSDVKSTKQEIAKAKSMSEKFNEKNADVMGCDVLRSGTHLAEQNKKLQNLIAKAKEHQGRLVGFIAAKTSLISLHLKEEEIKKIKQEISELESNITQLKLIL